MKKIFAAITLSCLLQSPAFATYYIDLTHEMSEQTHHWPGSAKFAVTKTYVENLPGGGKVSNRDYIANEHNGTHIDAPSHFAPGHVGVDKISLSKLIGPAIHIDVRDKAKQNPDYQISIADIKDWESKYGKIPEGSIVLLNTGYDQYWDDYRKYTGTSPKDKNAPTHFHFPGLHPETAKWLVENRKIKAIGIDTFSIDYGQTNQYLTHQILTKNDIPIFENVCHIDKLPPNHFNIFALPMKIKDGTGAPLRITAELPN